MLDGTLNDDDLLRVRQAEERVLKQIRDRAVKLLDEIKEDNPDLPVRWKSPSPFKADADFFREDYARLVDNIDVRLERLRDPQMPAADVVENITMLTAAKSVFGQLADKPFAGFDNKGLREIPDDKHDGFSRAVNDAHNDIVAIIDNAKPDLLAKITESAKESELRTLKTLEEKILNITEDRTVSSTDTGANYYIYREKLANQLLPLLTARRDTIMQAGRSYNIEEGMQSSESILQELRATEATARGMRGEAQATMDGLRTANDPRINNPQSEPRANLKAAELVDVHAKEMFDYADQRHRQLLAIRAALALHATEIVQQQPPQPPVPLPLPLPPPNVPNDFGGNILPDNPNGQNIHLGLKAAALEIVTGMVVSATFKIAAVAVAGAVGTPVIATAIIFGMGAGAFNNWRRARNKSRRAGQQFTKQQSKDALIKGAFFGFVGGAIGTYLASLIPTDFIQHPFQSIGVGPAPIMPPVTGNSITQAQDILRHLPSGTNLNPDVQSLVTQATSTNASALDVMKACKEVSFVEINTGTGTVQNGYSLVKAGWNVAQDNALAGNSWGKMLGLDYGYAQDISAPGIPGNSAAAVDLAKNIGAIQDNPWMAANPWRTGIAAKGLVP